MMMMMMIIIIIRGNFIMAMRLVLSAEREEMRLQWYGNTVCTEVKHKTKRVRHAKLYGRQRRRRPKTETFRLVDISDVDPADSHSIFISGASPLSIPR